MVRPWQNSVWVTLVTYAKKQHKTSFYINKQHYFNLKVCAVKQKNTNGDSFWHGSWMSVPLEAGHCPGFPISAVLSLCPSRASSSAIHNITLFVQQSSTHLHSDSAKSTSFLLVQNLLLFCIWILNHCCSKGTQNKGNEGLGSQATHSLSADGRNAPRNTSLSLPQKNQVWTYTAFKYKTQIQC